VAKAPSFTNRLIHETSPYLQQHAHNPVDWYPWGEEALVRARREDKPIFLSIGYSACHWCHVMERESFENPDIARLMNESFINVKVDREERQDLDQIYMTSVQLMTQHGGWPMSVFLTPELEPFYGGTYFPPDDRMGMPSFKRILMGVAHAWKTKREEVRKSGKQLTQAMEEMNRSTVAQGQEQALSLSLVDEAVTAYSKAYDSTYGGFGKAPKFFHTMELRLLLRHWKRTSASSSLKMVTETLERISTGGIYDHLGGGFHRYSTDAQWLVPHFEKMLYDNALLLELYLEAFQATKNSEFSRVATETLNYVLREMTSPDGGFYSTQDADTEGEEGKFYVWRLEQIFKTLDNGLAEQFCDAFGVTHEGNWEGKNILHRRSSTGDVPLAAAQRKLFAARAERKAPFRDEKILVSWNGWMIHSMALGFQVLGDERYLREAEKASDFILQQLSSKKNSGRILLHAYKDGKARFSAYLDDYASFVYALVTLYEASFDIKWVKAAVELSQTLMDEFWDPTQATFFYTARTHEKLITRPRDFHDGATPSGSSMAFTSLIRLGRLTANDRWLRASEEGLAQYAHLMKTMPNATAQALIALDSLINRPMEIVIAAGDSEDEREEGLKLIREKFLPNKVVLLVAKEAEKVAPLLLGKKALKGKLTTYICENFSCKAPLLGVEELLRELETR